METKQTSIIQSQSDQRTYKYLMLPNNLQCILIHDPDIDKSAACLDLKVGCALDPPEYPGVAHFLEHMLFMGTKKHPEEDHFIKFVRGHGGQYNGTTYLTNTTFFYSIANDAFSESLDIFSEFFKEPLLSESGAEREMNAVDNEYKNCLNSDFWKQFSLMEMNSHEGSYMHKFNCGSLETLQKPGIRKELLDFHDKWYSANQMKLAIVSNKPIEEQEELIKSLFSGIPDKEVVLPDLGSPAPYTEANLGKLYRIVPIKDEDVLSVVWQVPYTELQVYTQPANYVNMLLGHEGPNSLLSYLISEGLALQLCSYDFHDLWSMTTLTVDVTLT